MNHRQSHIYQLIHAIISYLQEQQAQTPGAECILQKLALMDLTPDNMRDVTPQGTRHEAVLNEAITGITAPTLNDIATNLRQAKEHLVWREDEGKYYQSGADLGDGYRRCNLHSLLICLLYTSPSPRDS